MDRFAWAEDGRRLDVDVGDEGAEGELENAEVAVRREVDFAGGAVGDREIVVAAAAGAHRLVHRAVFVEPRGATVHVLVRERAAEEGAVGQSRRIRRQDAEPKIAAVRRGVDVGFAGRDGHARGGGRGGVRRVERVRVAAPAAQVDFAAVADEEGRGADVHPVRDVRAHPCDELGGRQVGREPHDERAAVRIGGVCACS